MTGLALARRGPRLNHRRVGELRHAASAIRAWRRRPARLRLGIRERRGAVNWKSVGAALLVTLATALLLLEVPQIEALIVRAQRK